VTSWNLDNLSITAPQGFTGTFNLVVSARATEAVTAETASQSVPLTVTVLPAEVTSPLVLDLNGDGVNTVSLEGSSGRFDLLNTGAAIRSGWISAEDAFLAVDINGNGVIDDRSELFGGAIGEGFAKLAAFDSNFDGQVDASDERFAELLLWQDRNGNHKTDAGELSSLAGSGITALSTRYTLMPQVQNGNWLLEHGTATFANGATIGLVDAYFEIGKNEAQINPAARLVRRDEEMDRGAAITVHSELRKPELPLGPSPILLGAGTVNRPIERIDQAPPVIDWTGSAQNAFEQADTDARKKLRPTKSSWLADFLGTRQSVEYKDLAQRTGLKVVL